MKEHGFTMAEYISFHKLDVNMRDTPALKMVAEHLRNRGYEQKRSAPKPGESRRPIVWVRSNRKMELSALAERLRALEGK